MLIQENAKISSPTCWPFCLGFSVFIQIPLLAESGLIPGLCPANERRRYKVTQSLIG